MDKRINILEQNSQAVPFSTYQWKRATDGYEVEVDYLIEGMIPTSSFGVMYGPSGAYKSFLAMGLCAFISLGLTWNNRKVKQAGVLYVVAEGGRGASRRAQAWSETYADGEQLNHLLVIDEPTHIGSPQVQSMLEATIKDIESKTGTKIELVVLDTLARCFNSADENSTKDMNYFISGCDILRAHTGVTVLVVHHTGKDGQKARGSSALRAACDFEYKVMLNPDPSVERSLILTCEKMKDDEPMPRLQVNLKPVYLFTNQDGKDVSSLVIESEGVSAPIQLQCKKESLSPYQKALVEEVKARTFGGGSLLKEDIRLALIEDGFPPKNFSRTLNQLIGKSILIEESGSLKLAQCNDSPQVAA